MPRRLAPRHRTTITPDEPNKEHRWLVEFRADMQAQRDAAEQAGHDTTGLNTIISGLDEEINAAGMRGNVNGRTTTKRTRSTRRRQGAPDLSQRKMANTTLGRTFHAPDGKTYRPSLFVTLALPSYGRVRDGVPVDPATLMFPTAFGNPSHPDTFSHLFSRLAKKAGLGRWHPHELRHSGTSLMLAQGTPLHVVSEVFGHASIAITKDVYGHLLEGDRRAATEAISSALLGKLTPVAPKVAPTGAEDTG
ncbi:hypothetical protein E1267_15780 [Nonomuraea longispora]|uniref:Tyr recombinase domain-containing protein n=1 Tax=Nonomuraea longispora TaxID=1848320 RepID=A0A4R4NCL9_9ACTN|nr:tyrosine-type recombinase/integrase [Nonomuraea longispora]TDC06659.1 hypothetical protein E1267_15780 [Nonomuraea longispora]